jgi:hypothetical protein
MGERRPIYSIKCADQKIGYIEGDRAFDLFARPCASYDHASGLLRNLNTQMIVDYVSLKGSFVGPSSAAEELFPAPLQNGGEPLDDTFLISERLPFDDGSSQGERELQGKHLQSEPENLTGPSLQDERASSDRPADCFASFDWIAIMIRRRQLNTSLLGQDSIEQKFQHRPIAGFRHLNSLAQQVLLGLLQKRLSHKGGFIFRAGFASWIPLREWTTPCGAFNYWSGLCELIHNSQLQYVNYERGGDCGFFNKRLLVGIKS